MPLRGVGRALRTLAPSAGSAVSPSEQRLAEAFARFVGVPWAVPLSGARVGLWHLLAHLERTVGRGEIVMTALTASIVPNVVVAAGFDVRFVDVDARTFNAGADALLDAVGPKTRAVVATHLEGFPIRSDRLASALDDVLLLEDCAHAVDARIDGQRAGSLGDAALFSLGKGKPINALSGGVVSGRDPDLRDSLRASLDASDAPARRDVLQKLGIVSAMGLLTRRLAFDATLWTGVRVMAALDRDPLYDSFVDSFKPPGPSGPSTANTRLGPGQAELALAGLERAEEFAQARTALWTRFQSAAHDDLQTQQPVDGTTPAPLEFTLRVRDVRAARAALRRQGLDSQRTWMNCPAQLDAFAGTRGQHPVAEDLADHLIYLPFYPGLTPSERDRICALLADPPDALRAR